MGFPVCQECGLVHPPTPLGECPVAKEQKEKQEDEAMTKTEIGNIVIKIKEDILEKIKGMDKEKSIKILNSIRNNINNTIF